MGKKGGKAKGNSDTRKQAERQLKASEARYRELFNNMSSGVAVYQAKKDGEDFVFTDFNRAAERIDKIKKEEVIGKSVLEMFPGVKEFGLFEVFQRVWKTGKSERFPVSQYQDERIVGWRDNYVYKLPSGEIVAIYDDVTERKQAELAVRMSEQCFRAIADYTYFWEIWVSPRGRLLWTNPAVHRVTGYSIKELMTMSDFPMSLIYEEDRDRMSRAFKSALRGSTGREVQFRLRRKDGTVIWAEVSWQPIYNERGISQGHRASVREITARKHAEEALQESEYKYRTLLKNIPQKIFYKDLNSAYVLCNESYAEDLKIKPGEIKGKTDYDFYPEELAGKYRADDKRIMQSGKAEEIEEGYIKAGQRVTVHTFKAPVKDEKGNTIGIFGVFWDITERKQMEDALRAARDDWENIFESISDGVLILDREHHIIDANRATIGALQRSKDEIIGRYCYELFHCSDHPPEQCPHEKVLASSHPETAEMEIEILDRVHLVTVAPVFDKEGNIAKTIHIARDITERKRAEETRDMLNKELEAKNEELESILYVASHDLRAPLVNIQGFSHELSRICELIHSAFADRGIAAKMGEKLNVLWNKDIPEALGYILSSTSKMDSLLSGLLRLSRLGQAAMKVERLDMNSMLADITRSMEYQMKKAAVSLEIEPLHPCLGDAAQINQVFSNLLDNAIKYLDDSRPGRIHIYSKVEDGESIYCVEDNGVGIAAEHQDKIFEIFHQLEPDRKKGEGLGLTIVRRILDRHNGRIWLESECGKGSKFFVSLPSV